MRSIKRLLPILGLLATCAAAAATSALASTTQQAIIQDDGQLHANPQGTLLTMRSLGATRVRVAVVWNTIAPSARGHKAPKGFNASNPAAYPAHNWSFYDTVVRDAAADGMSVDFLLTGGAPLWATGAHPPSGGPYFQWKPSDSAFSSFVRAIGTRYNGTFTPAGSSTPLPRVNFWSIWNEPNYGPNLAPQAIANDTIEVGAVAYRGLLDAAWSGLVKTGHGPSTDTILIGETAPRGLDHPIGNFSGVKPLRFIRALYCVGANNKPLRGSAAVARSCPTTGAGTKRFRTQHAALFQANGFSDHPYEQDTPPNTPTYACGQSVCTNSHHQSDPQYADLPEVPRLARLLDSIQRTYGSPKQFPIWSTEYGFATDPPEKAIKISPATAAEYMNWAEYLSYKDRYLASYSQYLLVDPSSGDFASGLEFSNGKPKPGFAAYRMPLFLPVTSTKAGSSLEVWGGARPAGFARQMTGAQQSVAIQFQAGGTGRWVTEQTVPIANSAGYFDVHIAFPGSGNVRTSWALPSPLSLGAGGVTVYSRTVAIKL